MLTTRRWTEALKEKKGRRSSKTTIANESIVLERVRSAPATTRRGLIRSKIVAVNPAMTP
jgi:hypothetical protein